MNNLIILLAYISGILQIQSDTLLDRYPIKSGMIKYQYAGRANCIEVIFFDDYGELYYDLKTTSSTEKGKVISRSKVKIQRQDTVIMYSTENNTASMHLVSELTSKLKHNIISNEILRDMGYSMSGYEEISGVICDKYSGENGTMWIWNNIILKSEMIIMDISVKMEAIEVLTGVEVADSKFKLPKNYKLIN